MLIEHVCFQGTVLERCFANHGVHASKDTFKMQALAWGLTLNLPNQLPGEAVRAGQRLTLQILGELRRETDKQSPCSHDPSFIDQGTKSPVRKAE